MLALKEVEFLGRPRHGELAERLAHLRDRIVAGVERKHFGRETTGNIPERVKLLRGKIQRELSQPQSPPGEEPLEEFRDDLDSLFVAVQLYSYPGQYLRQSSSVHRIAETILKLEEDVFGMSEYLGPQSVHVRFGAPLNVKAPRVADHHFRTEVRGGD